MYDCNDDLIAFHNEKVTLPQVERTEMRERRDANRRRLRKGLDRDDQPRPIGCNSQGSYAMRTMVQQAGKDYDIDDGVYFDKDKLKGPQGGDMSPASAKEMVRRALHDDSFKRPPEVLKNCVRIYYDAGYHVDVPVYRKVTQAALLFGEDETWYELASTDWRRSDPLAVTNWFTEENKKLSPDGNNGGQLRRNVRFLKIFASSRPSWRDRNASGFMISKLVVEKYASNVEREDRALYETMVAIRDRLQWDLEIAHPVIEGEMLTNGPDDGRSKFLLEKLDWAIQELQVLFHPQCTREQALSAWGKVFNTNFFSERLARETQGQQAAQNTSGSKQYDQGIAAAVLIGAGDQAAARRPVDKRGGGRYA